MAENKVTREELEAKFRSLGLGAKDAAAVAKLPVPLVGALGGGVAIIGAYLLGRRKGRKRATVLEVRRG